MTRAFRTRGLVTVTIALDVVAARVRSGSDGMIGGDDGPGVVGGVLGATVTTFAASLGPLRWVWTASIASGVRPGRSHPGRRAVRGGDIAQAFGRRNGM